MNASIFDSAVSHNRRSDAAEKKRRNSVSTFGHFRLRTSFESSPVSVNGNSNPEDLKFFGCRDFSEPSPDSSPKNRDDAQNFQIFQLRIFDRFRNNLSKDHLRALSDQAKISKTAVRGHKNWAEMSVRNKKIKFLFAECIVCGTQSVMVNNSIIFASSIYSYNIVNFNLIFGSHAI